MLGAKLAELALSLTIASVAFVVILLYVIIQDRRKK